MCCVAVGWLVWVVLVAVVVVGWLVCVVFAVGWRLVAVWSVFLLFWGVAVCWPVADSVVVGWVAMLGVVLVGVQLLVWRLVGWLLSRWEGGLLGVVGSRGGYIVGSGFVV